MLIIFIIGFFMNIIFSCLVLLILLGKTEIFVNSYLNFYNIKEYLNSDNVESSNVLPQNNISLFLISSGCTPFFTKLGIKLNNILKKFTAYKK
jgi:hypothetical protein